MQDCFLLRKKKEQIAAEPGVTVEADTYCEMQDIALKEQYRSENVK